LWRQEGLRRRVGDHRSTRQPVGEISDRRKGQAVIEMQVMGESDRSPWERIIEWNLPYRLRW
jgi:hypothetical protein